MDPKIVSYINTIRQKCGDEIANWVESLLGEIKELDRVIDDYQIMIMNNEGW